MREMFLFLRNLKGNAKSSVLTEPLWGIPANLFMPFATLYMFHLGVLDAQIGLLLAIGRFVQMFMALLGGVITDKFGRRLTTAIGDFIAWSIPSLIWAFSQNFWWFLAAVLVNSAWQITGISWECLWVDDNAEDGGKIGQIFNWIYICGLLAVFFAPIAGFFVARYSLVPVVRVLYLFAFVSMTAKLVLLYIFSTETKRGLERMEQTKNTSLVRLLFGYVDVFKQMIRSKIMIRALAIQALVGVTLLISGTFFALYATQNLGLPEPVLAYLPILRAVVMLSFLFFIQNRLNVFKEHYVMLFGAVLFVSAHVLLVALPPSSWGLLAVYTFIEACAGALLLPRMDSLAANAIEPQERARIRSLFNVVILAVSSPFAFLAGLLSDMDRRLPFLLNIGIFALVIIIVYMGRRFKPLAAREGSHG